MDGSAHRLSGAQVALMSFSTGLVVASNYYAQPLLHTLAGEFGLTAAGAGIIITVAQLSYAVGLLLLVPLGDMLERRSMIVGMTILCAVGLLITASAPNLALVLLGTAIAALFAVVSQVLVPLGATLAAPEQRGKVVGTLMSGLLLGILLARTVAGGLSSLGDWRTVYWVAAAVMIVTAIALARVLPHHHEHAGLPYHKLLASVFTLFANESVLRLRAVLGAFSFAIFSVLWTSMAFLLASDPYHFSDGTIGLFGLVGAAGALAANLAGRLADKGKTDTTTWLGLILLLLSWVPIALARESIIALLIGILVLDLAVQGVHVTNQNVIYKLFPHARNRVTAGYMTSYFIGGSTGSLLSATAYAHWGWNGVSAVGALLSLGGLLTWVVWRQVGHEPAGLVQAQR
ncbi:putative MFS family arabinose efflux permease [Silvimonas terrae]|uniref:Putative MFS family arabinose efflux permease n=1 Tax=Silvimonas terrae TaxID=300266 RepID=A0A840RIP1_9NEIS|nr:MFS transporter [Silvimonas terrae]MBB5192041.1 putative MFS family arabinose efflux permease [Silvimonas terrae]